MEIAIRANGQEIWIPIEVAKRLELRAGQSITGKLVTHVIKQTAQMAVFPRRPLRKRIRGVRIPAQQ